MKPEMWRQKMVQALAMGEDRSDQQLAERLATCNESQQCNLPMCQFCVGELRSLLFGFLDVGFLDVDEYHRQTFPVTGPGLRLKLPTASFSKTVRGGSYPVGQLDQIDLRSINKRLREQYAYFPFAVAATDIFLVEGRSRRARPFWQVGVLGVAVGLPPCSAPTGVLADAGWRPMPFSVYLPAPLRLLFKSALRREFGKGYRQHPLQPEHLRELSRCLGRCDMTDRYVLSGCQLHDDCLLLDRGAQELLAECALEFRALQPL